MISILHTVHNVFYYYSHSLYIDFIILYLNIKIDML